MPYADPEARRRYRAAYYAAQREEAIARAAQWRAENPERSRQLTRESQARRRECPEVAERDRAKNRAYKAGPGRARASERERLRKAKIQDGERIDPLVLLELHDGVCGICGKDVDPLSYEVDHRVPLSRGGEHTYENVQPAHPACNRRKHAREEA